MYAVDHSQRIGVTRHIIYTDDLDRYQRHFVVEENTKRERDLTGFNKRLAKAGVVPPHSQVLVARYVYGQTLKEIAEGNGLSMWQAKKILREAEAMIKDGIKK